MTNAILGRAPEEGEIIQAFGTLGPSRLGLSEAVRTKSVLALNRLVAHTMALRDLYKKAHWQTSGATFYGLHLLFDKHHGEQLEITDALAERVQTLGGVALALARDVVEESRIARAPRGRERLGSQLRRLLDAEFDASAIDDAIAATLPGAHDAAGLAQAREALTFVCERLLPALRRTDEEVSHILDGLDGRYVPPGPSGAPTRGMAHVLPTGRNFYSVDCRAVPTPAAWRLGWRSAELVVEQYLQRHGTWPRQVALSAWGTANG